MGWIRRSLKRIARSVATVLTSPLIVVARMEAQVSDGECWFVAIAEALSLIPGRTGSYLRLAFYRGTLEACGGDVSIGFGTKINHRTTRIGHGVVFGSYCNIGTVTIGDHCLIGSRVCIPSGNRQHDFLTVTKNITDHPPVFQRVCVGSNTWIGEGAIVLADVGVRCVVAAGSVVFRPVPSGLNAVGNPARMMSRTFSQPASVRQGEAASGLPSIQAPKQYADIVVSVD